MKDTIKNCFKYIQTVLFIFAGVFLFTLLFNLFALSKADPGETGLIAIIRPCFFISLFLSFFLSFLIFGIFQLKKIEKHILICFMFPLLFTFILLVPVYLLLHPGPGDLEFLNYRDARLYVTEKTFIQYNQDIPPELDAGYFNRLLSGSVTAGQKRVLQDSYKAAGNGTVYRLIPGLSFRRMKKLQSVLYSITNIEPIVFYFGSVEKQRLIDVRVFQEGDISFYKELACSFTDDGLVLTLPGSHRKFTFIKQEFLQATIFTVLDIKILFDAFKEALSPFFTYSGSILSLGTLGVLYLIWAYIVLSAGTFVTLKEYPLLGFSINIFLCAGIFFGLKRLYAFYDILFGYQKIVTGFKPVIFGVAVLFFFLLKNSLSYLIEREK